MIKTEMRDFMEVISETNCVNVFKHETDEEISAAFTKLWTQIINKKENQGQIYITRSENTSCNQMHGA